MAAGHDVQPDLVRLITDEERPFEACGTSGMKTAANGGLNLSIPTGGGAKGSEDWAGGAG